MNEKRPPASKRYEHALLSIVIFYATVEDVTGMNVGLDLVREANLQPEDFYWESTQTLWRLILELAEQNIAPDAQTLCERFKCPSVREPMYFVTGFLVDAGLPVQVPYYARKIRELRKARSDRDHALRILDAVDERDWPLARELREELPGDDNPLGGLVVPLEDLYETEPERVDPLLTLSVDEELEPFLLKGRAGMLAGPGGTGKSYLLLQLAIAVASGFRWLDSYEVVEPGRVFVAMAEEDEQEIRRRMRLISSVLQLSPEEKVATAANIELAPLRNQDVGFVARTEGRYGNLIRTPFYQRFVRQLENDPVGWQLIVLDPLSRFMGSGEENSAADSTFFVELLEGLTAVKGNPACIVAHHTNKAALSGDTNQGAARGSTALVDGLRWVCNIDFLFEGKGKERKVVKGQARFNPVKTNYGPGAQALVLRRVHGALRRKSRRYS